VLLERKLPDDDLAQLGRNRVRAHRHRRGLNGF
jgi:hypothetical protein